MFHLDPTITLGAILTVAAGVLRVMFQVGTTVQVLKGVGEKVDDLIKKEDARAAENQQLRAQLATLDLRLSLLEKRQS